MHLFPFLLEFFDEGAADGDGGFYLEQADLFFGFVPLQDFLQVD